MRAMRVFPVVAVVVACSLRADGADRKPLRLLTYNLNYANHDRAATMRAIADTDADVVLVQESDAEWKRALSETFANKYKYQAYRLHGRYAGGIAILSKLPITKEEEIASPLDTWFPAQRIVVDGPFGAVQILNVHLRPAVDGGSWIKGYVTTRPMRLKEVEAYWPKLAKDLPTIVAGDFNETSDGSALAFLGKQGLARVPTKGPHTWHYELLAMDIDHVLIDGALTAHDGEVLDAGTSDHRPVVVTVEKR